MKPPQDHCPKGGPKFIWEVAGGQGLGIPLLEGGVTDSAISGILLLGGRRVPGAGEIRCPQKSYLEVCSG